MSEFFKALRLAEEERIEAATVVSEPLAARRGASRPPDRTTVDEPRPASSGVADGRLDPRLVSLVEPGGLAAEQYRMLRHRVQQLNVANGSKIIAVTSPIQGDGKTITAINLAGALAQESRIRVLLVDVDLHRPGVASRLGLRSGAGADLLAVLKGERRLADIAHIPTMNLWVLVPNEPARAPHEILSSPGFTALIEEVRHSFDYVILDTPPMVPFHDGRVIATRVDAFLVVVAAHRTPRKMLEETLNAMDPAKVAGLVFNADDTRPSDYDNYRPIR
jgi:capsular exopolysaccharide synthesis family protein